VPSLPPRPTLLAWGFALAALAVVARGAQLQLVQGSAWRARAAAQQTVRVVLPARRGTIADRNGVPLALTQETFTIGVAPRELDDAGRVATLVARATGRPRSEVAAAVAGRRVWVEWPGPYTWPQVAPLRDLTGVHLQRRLERFYPRPELAPRLVGRVDVRLRGATGLERALDTLLAGRAGMAVRLRDPRGTLYPTSSLPSADPVDGADVTLTLDAELQEIAERALAAAVREAGATGGDVVILQPATGEVLAAASVRRAGGAAVGAISDTYEPGSTAKIFTAAALLRSGRATPHDTVFTEHGTWRANGRTITDTHKAGLLSLTEVIRLSSNIGIAKLGARLTPEEQYETLRDFGFGTPTGIELAGEAAGRLRPPRAWTDASAASLAMGYEFSVTPVQLAAAYATFANGGVLVEPALVREVRGPDGAVRWRHAPRPVRRVLSQNVAAQLMHVLREVVEEGTGRRAALGSFTMAGKTGTARRNIGGRYVEGRYTASFVGLFPAVDPQLVLVVKIDDPAGDYFGGETAAPLTRTILEAALATPAVTLDRSRLRHRRAPAGPAADGGDPAAVVATVPWPLAPVADEPAAERAVPDVTGQSPRAAARMLHRAGFRVRLDGWGPARGTSPAAGTTAPAGSVVVVRGGGNRAS
jgi:cell division protein FtsI (penicillin-binding protein 3)